MDAWHGLQHLCCTLPFLAVLNMLYFLGYHKIQTMTICFAYKHQKTGLKHVFSINFFVFNMIKNTESSGFEAAMILTSLLHKSATVLQIYSTLVSTFKFKSFLSNILNTEKLDLRLLCISQSNIAHVLSDTLYVNDMDHSLLLEIS